MYKRSFEDYDGGFGGKRSKTSGGRPEIRVLLPSKIAGSVIGKGGKNIQQLRSEYGCTVRIPDCPGGPERILEISGDSYDPLLPCLQAAVPYMYEGLDDTPDKELRFLIHQSIAGGVIGKGGEKIKEIRQTTGAGVKVSSNCAPQSTDRVVQLTGSLDKIMAAAEEVYEKVKTTDIKGEEMKYDPLNFDAAGASDYLGWGGSDGLGGFGGGRGGGGRGGGGDGQGGRGRGDMPPGLRGREIGMYFAKKSREKQKIERTEAHLPKDKLHYLERELEKALSAQSAATGKSDHLHKLKKNIRGNAMMDEMNSLEKKPRLDLKDNMEIMSSKDDYLLRDLLDAESNETTEIRKRPKNLDQFRKTLPAAEKRDYIIDLVRKHQVTVITGETGCGKTTQVPQFLLEDWMEREGDKCRIVITQPRRISAISVAERISQERGEILGGSVGYQIRLESILPRRNGSILLCTTGIVLQWLQSCPTLDSITHLVLDEIHERDIHSDFLMTICQNILPVRPDLRLILMSATMDSNKFSRYFQGCPSVHIPGFTYPVQEFYLEDVLQMTNFRPKTGEKTYSRNHKSRSQYMEEMGPFLRHIESSGKYSSSVLEYLNNPECEELNMDLTASLVSHIHNTEDEGAILVFVPGWEQISKLNRLLEPGGLLALSGSSVIFPLHSLMPTSSQREIFKPPSPGTRKVIIATNIAETSITIEDVVYVVDCGKIKIKNFDVDSNTSTLQPEWISLANLKQRRGRAGRVQPGKCYHLFTKAREGLLESYLPPEICRTSLEEVILQIKLLELGTSSQFLQKVLDPPSIEAVRLSLNTLRTINALELRGGSEELTPLGFHLAQLPLDPQTGKMILMGAIFSCLDPVLSVAASLSFKDAFMVPLGKEKDVDRIKQLFAGRTISDHMMLANVITEYTQSRSKSSFCWDNYISESVIKMLVEMKSQLTRHLFNKKFLSGENYKSEAANLNSNNEALVRAIICSGLYPNVAKIKRVKKHEHADTILCTAREKRILFHPKSVVSKTKKFPYSWVVFHTKQKSSQTYLHDATVVSPLSLLFFGQEVRTGVETLEHSRERLETVSADSFITFNCERSTASIVSRARSALDSVIEEKVSHPSSTCWQSSQGRILNLIVSLLDTELEGLQFEEEEEEQGSNQRGEPGNQRFENSYERGEGKDGRNLRGKDRTRREGERIGQGWCPW